MIELSLIIPAYNEESRIGPTVRKAHAYLSASSVSFEILVVDDGSSDGTVALVSALSTELRSITLMELPQNMGKGAAVRRGMLAAKGSIRVFTDADGSTPIEELDKLLAPLKEGRALIAIGSRYLRQSEVAVRQPRYRVIWSRIVHRIVRRNILPGIADAHCGFKAFTADAAQAVFSRCAVNGWSFDLEALAVAQKHGLPIVEVPVKWENDERSKAKISQLPKEIYNVYRIRRRLSANPNALK